MNLKEKIVHESLKLFSLKGYLSTSIEDILTQSNASKGGFYNHFKSKDELFLAVLSAARKIWRNRVLDGVDAIENPLEKVIRILQNYRDRYLKDSENIPGGCVFVTLSVELDDQRADFAKEIQRGFAGVSAMIKGLLVEAKMSGALQEQVNTEAVAGMLFSGMLGASVLYGMDKSVDTLNRAINPLIDYVENLRSHVGRITQGH